jgi:hypothetical protein
LGVKLALDGDGSVYVAGDTRGGWPLHDAMLRQPACLYYDPTPHNLGNGPAGSALAILSPDASTVELGTYLQGCGVPGLAIGNDLSVYVGVSSFESLSPTGNAGEVLNSPLSPFAAVLKIEPRVAQPMR